MTRFDFQALESSMDQEHASRRQRAMWIHVITGFVLVAVALPTLLRTSPAATPQYIGNAVTILMGLLALTSAWVTYKHGATYGSTLFVVSILVISLGIPFYAHGLGLQAGIITAVIAVAVATATLPGREAALVTVIALVLESLVVLVDLYLDRFLPQLVPAKLESPGVNLFLVFVVMVSIAYIYRQYHTYTLRSKLVIFFSVVAITAVGAVAFGTNYLTRSQLTQQAGLTTAMVAEDVAEELISVLSSQVQLLETAGTQWEETARNSTNLLTGTPAQITENLLAADATWQSSANSSTLVRSVLENPTASQLRSFQRIAPDHLEILLTNQYGATVAATNRTTHYYHADEAWWQVAYNSGQGAVYVSSPTSTIELAVAVRLDDGTVVGVLHSTVDVSMIVRVLERARFGKTGEAVLQANQQALFGSTRLRADELLALNDMQAESGQIQINDTPSIMSMLPLNSVEDAQNNPWISRLNWSIIAYQDLDEALQPAEAQTRTTISISLLVLALAALAGVFASHRIAAPIVGLTQAASRIVNGDLTSRAPIETEDEIGALAQTFNRMTAQLSQTLNGLERNVAERTSDLEMARLMSDRRAQDLQSVSEISRIISGEQRLEILLSLVTRLVSEKFDFYHTGIFLIDETRQFAVLQAASSEGGQRMLARGHRLEVGRTGLVGNVAHTGEGRIALDVGTDAVYFDNPELPRTRSEMALPLTVRGVTVGVLDVQSTKPGAFTREDSKTLGILADQIAIAIENARLFGQNRQALAEVQSLYNQYLRKEWEMFGQQESQVGYLQSPLGGRPLQKPFASEEIRLALQRGSAIVVDGKDESSHPLIVVPVRLRGETIGVLNIKAPTAHRRWSQDEINLAQAVSDRLALALDNARLLIESQRQTAKEQKIGEVTAKIGASINLRNVLQTAVEELGRALPGSEVIIQFDKNGKQA